MVAFHSKMASRAIGCSILVNGCIEILSLLMPVAHGHIDGDEDLESEVRNPQSFNCSPTSRIKLKVPILMYYGMGRTRRCEQYQALRLETEPGACKEFVHVWIVPQSLYMNFVCHQRQTCRRFVPGLSSLGRTSSFWRGGKVWCGCLTIILAKLSGWILNRAKSNPAASTKESAIKKQSNVSFICVRDKIDENSEEDRKSDAYIVIFSPKHNI